MIEERTVSMIDATIKLAKMIGMDKMKKTSDSCIRSVSSKGCAVRLEKLKCWLLSTTPSLQ
jgi:hypothetical protein